MTGRAIEEGLRARVWRGTTYWSGRARLGDLGVFAKRFPSTVSGPPFVLVHGIGVSSRYFHPLAVALAEYGPVYLIDLPGYGAAPSARRDVSLGEHAAVLAELLEALGLVDPVLVGHSMGTQIVTRLAVDRPDVTDRLVLIGPTMDPAARTFLRASLRLGHDLLREPPLTNAIVVWDYIVRCGPVYYFRQLPHLLDDRIERRMPLLTARTLVLRGDRDPIAPAVWSRRLAELAPDGRFEEVEGAHVMMFTDPARAARLIEEHAAQR